MEKSNLTVLEFAKWFVKNKLDEPHNTLSGNVKLQKLLFFAQLIYMAKNNGELLFKEPFYAFEHGMVEEKTRNVYKSNIGLLMDEKFDENIFNDKQIEALNLTAEIFGDATADELSELSHQFDCWDKYFKESKTKNSGWFNKAGGKVPYSDLRKELNKIEDVLFANEKLKDVTNEEVEDY